MLLASQMWCLGRLLPLMIGDQVSEDDEKWKNFLLLLSIMDYLLAPTITLNCISHLRELIQEHHETFKDLYPSCTTIKLNTHNRKLYMLTYIFADLDHLYDSGA